MTNPASSHGSPTGNPPSVAATSSGLAPNVAAALSYVLGLITGAIFLVIEKENRYVRFHAAQSVAVSLLFVVASIGLSVVSGVLVFVPVLGWIVAFLLSVGLAFAVFVLWILLMWRAYQGREWEVPLAGGIARKLMG